MRQDLLTMLLFTLINNSSSPRMPYRLPGVCLNRDPTSSVMPTPTTPTTPMQVGMFLGHYPGGLASDLPRETRFQVISMTLGESCMIRVEMWVIGNGMNLLGYLLNVLITDQKHFPRQVFSLAMSESEIFLAGSLSDVTKWLQHGG